MKAARARSNIASRQRIWAAGTYMKLRDPDLLATFLEQKKERTGLNASDLARFVPCSRQFISRLRHGEDDTCKPVTADRIARFLDVPLSVLFAEMTSSDTGQATKQQQGKRAA